MLLIKEGMCERCRGFSVRIVCNRPYHRSTADTRRGGGMAETASGLCRLGIVDKRVPLAAVYFPPSTSPCLLTQRQHSHAGNSMN